jgi:hypothetical protein
MYAFPLKETQHNRIDNAEIVIVPSHERYAEQMEELQSIAYAGDPEILHAEEFRSHLRHFPEGQFVAIDTATERVIGLTSGMRIDFNPAEDLRETWRATTGDG